MQDNDMHDALINLNKGLTLLGQSLVQFGDAYFKRIENTERQLKPQKEKPIEQETKVETKPEETSGPTFKEVSTKFFALLDRIAEELSPEKAQANGVKLVNKYCGGEPISKDTLKPENFEALLADIDKCNKAMDERKNGK